jgi:Protein of unknown function (DUF2637)
MPGTDKAIRWSTAAAVIGVAVVAAVVSYEHAYDLVRAHGEEGWTARLIPLTVDGLIWASSMVMLDSVRRGVPVPSLARWLLGLGIAATLAANVAHGFGHGPAGAVVAAWPAVALVGSYELLMLVIRGAQQPAGDVPAETARVSAGMPDALRAQAFEEFAEDVVGVPCRSWKAVELLTCGSPRPGYPDAPDLPITRRLAGSYMAS